MQYLIVAVRRRVGRRLSALFIEAFPTDALGPAAADPFDQHPRLFLDGLGRRAFGALLFGFEQLAVVSVYWIFGRVYDLFGVCFRVWLAGRKKTVFFRYALRLS